MALYQLFRRIAVMFGNRLQQGMVRGVFAQRIPAFPIQRNDQRGPRHQLGDKAADSVLIRDPGDFDVKLARQP